MPPQALGYCDFQLSIRFFFKQSMEDVLYHYIHYYTHVFRHYSDLNVPSTWFLYS